MVESGLALGLCQPTFRPPAGLTHRPMRGAPLRWRLVLGWHPDSPAARSAPKLMEMAQDAYQEVVARNPAYVEWMRRLSAPGRLGRRPGAGRGRMRKGRPLGAPFLLVSY